ncbi:unnamed protein product [Cuscuta campestris]|uniref:Pentacotripeptide-repeat region of PRORP domain-containing protein n=1 Tax=Cuscuta campestris TaxID=132261 RepID=A0A484MK24_9ASTE|nr:unnamed protein product [Cuscuta campestris]
MNLQMLVSSESHFLVRVLNGTFQILDSIKDRIGLVVSDFFSSIPSSELLNARNGGIMQSAICHKPKTKDSLSERNELPPNPDGDMGAVFNVLDSMLKDMLDRLKSMREETIRTCVGFDSISKKNLHIDEQFIRELCMEGKVGTAFSLCSKVMHKYGTPSIYTHNYLINGLCETGNLDKALWIVEEMKCRGPSPSCATYNALIKGYILMNNIDKALEIFSTMDSNGITPNRVSCNILVDALCKKGFIRQSKKLLKMILGDKHDDPSLITSTIIMDGCFKHGDSSQALATWERLRSIPIDRITYNVIINGYCLKRDKIMALSYTCQMLKTGFMPDIFSYNMLIGLLSKERQMDEACYIFSVMTRMGVRPDRITYKIIIQGLCMSGDVAKANYFLCCMLENSIIPEPLIWNVIIHGYGKLGNVHRAEDVRSQMVASGVLPNVFTYNALIYTHINDQNFIKAYSMKREMLLHGVFPDAVTFNMLIGAACSVGDIDFALRLHGDMLRMGCEPDAITYTELLRYCCISYKMKEADWLFDRIRSSGIRLDHVPFLLLMKRYWGMRELDKVYVLYQEWLMIKDI